MLYIKLRSILNDKIKTTADTLNAADIDWLLNYDECSRAFIVVKQINHQMNVIKQCTQPFEKNNVTFPNQIIANNSNRDKTDEKKYVAASTLLLNNSINFKSTAIVSLLSKKSLFVGGSHKMVIKTIQELKLLKLLNYKNEIGNKSKYTKLDVELIHPVLNAEEEAEITTKLFKNYGCNFSLVRSHAKELIQRKNEELIENENNKENINPN